MEQFTIIELSNNGSLIFPRISGNNVIWQEEVGDDTEIFLYNGSETIQLTDNDVEDDSVEIFENNIVWESGSDNQQEIFFYNGSETIQLTDNDVEDNLRISIGSLYGANSALVGDNVFWRNETEENRANFFYNGSETIQITDRDVFEDRVADELIAELGLDFYYYTAGFDNEREVFVYDGNESTQLTDNNVLDTNLQSSATSNSAIWQRYNTSESGEETNSLFLAIPNNINLASGTTVYRFFNNDTGVHFYTANEAEKDTIQQLDNYSFEGASYQSVDPLTGNPEPTPVYRFLDRNTGTHFYTVSETETEAVEELDNFSFEGEAFAAYTTEVEGSIPIYRFFNSTTGAHFYTPSATERDNVENNLSDFQSEGIAYFALPIE